MITIDIETEEITLHDPPDCKKCIHFWHLYGKDLCTIKNKNFKAGIVCDDYDEV